MDALTVSVGFFAVEDVRPASERQADYCGQSEASEHDSWGRGHEAQLIRVLERTIVRM